MGRQRIEGLEIERIRDVDDDPAGEALTVDRDHIGQRRVGHGQDDNVARHRGASVTVRDQFCAVATLGGQPGDGLTHVAGTDDGELCHKEAPLAVERSCNITTDDLNR